MKLTSLSDNELVTNLSDLLIEERERLVVQLEYFIELERRKFFFGYESLWALLVHEYRMEEKTAERRIWASRLLGRHPELKAMLESGKMNLSLLEIASGYASREKMSGLEFLGLVQDIQGMSNRAARRELASRYPKSFELPQDRIIPLTEEYSEVRFVADDRLLDQLDEVRGLLAHSHPKATIAELLKHLTGDYLKRHHPEEKARRAKERELKKHAQREAEKGKTGREVEERPEQPPIKIIGSPSAPRGVPQTPIVPRPMSRAPSQALIHALTLEQGYQCSYIDPTTGRKCGSHFGLEIDHIQEWSRGGLTELKNLRYLCRGHHRRVSFLQFGESSRYFRPKRQ